MKFHPVMDVSSVMDASAVYRQLTGIEPLNGLDYSTWRIVVGIMLDLFDYEFVLTEAKPLVPTADTFEAYNLKYGQWDKANTVAVKLIRVLISKAIRGGWDDQSVLDTGFV